MTAAARRKTLAGRVYAILLKALPRDHRDRYGDEMLSVFDSGLAELTGSARVSFVGRAFAALALHAVEARFRWAAGILRDAYFDVKVATRALRRRPGFSLTVIVTLGVGIGLDTAVFGFVNGLLLRPLPYEEPGRLVQLSETAPGIGSMDVSLPDFAIWREETRAFTGMFAFDDTRFLLAGEGPPVRIEGAVVSPGFLTVLGVAPVEGRGFASTEETPGLDGVVIISDRLWADRFGRGREAVGQTVEFNGRRRVIIGVAPAGFHFPEVADIWVPLAFNRLSADPEAYGFDVIGRIAPGLDLDDARADGVRVATLLRQMYPATKGQIGTDAYPLRFADVPGGLAGASIVLLLAVTLVLLVACSNVANLMLARGDERLDELNMRRAMGAGRGRIVRHVLTESAVLAALGSVGAIVAATLGLRALEVLLPEERPYWLDFSVDGRVLAWTLFVAVGACLVVSYGPARQAIRSGGAAGRTSRHVVGRGRSRLVTSQVALATALVACAVVAIRALTVTRASDPGLTAEGVFVQGVVLPPWDYEDPADRRAVSVRMLEGLASIPGVEAVSIVGSVPFLASGEEVAFEIDAGLAGEAGTGVLNGVGPDYFRAMSTAVSQGRPFTTEEMRAQAPVGIVSQSLAAQLWGDGQALGRQIRHSHPDARSPVVPDDAEWLTVVGVAADVRQEGPGRPTRGELYVPWSRHPPFGPTFVLSARRGPAELAARVRQSVSEVEANAVLQDPTTMSEALAFSLWAERLTARSLTVLGGLGFALALLGINGLVAYTVSRRKREFGVRMALGASGSAVRSLVIKEVLRMMVPGLALGLAAAGAAVWGARAAVFWVPSLDPVALFGTGFFFLAAGLAAALGPVVKATRGDPTAALSV